MRHCAGWRRIDEEPVKAVESDGITEIELSGYCAQCDRLSQLVFGRIYRPLARFFHKAT